MTPPGEMERLASKVARGEEQAPRAQAQQGASNNFFISSFSDAAIHFHSCLRPPQPPSKTDAAAADYPLLTAKIPTIISGLPLSLLL